MPMIEIYFDGSCEPTNPDGNMGIGCLAKYKGENIEVFAQHIPRDRFRKTTTNNVAEYLGFLKALEFCRKHTDKECFIMGDSKFVVNQMNGRWKINDGKPYSPYARQAAQELLELNNVKKIRWIPREMNFEADGLSKM